MKCDKRWLHCGIHWHQVSRNPVLMSCMRVIFLSCSRNSSGAEIIFEWIIWRATLRADIAVFGKF